jgi:hypothetical protein
LQHGDGSSPGVVEGWPRKGAATTATAAIVRVSDIVAFALPLPLAFSVALVVAAIVGVGVGGHGPVRELGGCC